MSYADDIAKQMTSVQPMPDDAWDNMMTICDAVVSGGIPEGKINLFMAGSGGSKAMMLRSTDEDDG